MAMAKAVVITPSICQMRPETASAAGRAHMARLAMSRAMASSGSPPATGMMPASAISVPSLLGGRIGFPGRIGVVLVHLVHVAVVDLDHRSGEAEHGGHDGEYRRRSQPPVDHEREKGQEKRGQHQLI